MILGNKTRFALYASAALAALAAPLAVEAQEISSSIGGQVFDPAGNPLAGQTVTITDTRTGSRRSATTGNNGNFDARGLKVGGPYILRVVSDEYANATITDIFISLSGGSTFNITLEPSSSDVEEISVTAVASVRSTLAIGPGSAFSLEDIKNQPSISRQVRDVIRIDPRVNIGRAAGGNGFGISCLGGNSRSNSFTIDGVRSADGFGLNASGNLARNTFPIPFDTLAATSVEFAPFDVEYGQFTGCNINVVTKSGTNEFHGSAFFLYNNENLTGDSLEGEEVIDAEFDRYNWGAELGGPIIKDKLFFYGSYEETDTADTQNSGPSGLGFANDVDITATQADQLRNILINSYGRDPGDVVRTLPETSRRFFGRLDWNINDDHRFEVTYTRLEEENVEPDDFGFAGFTFQDNFEVEGSESDTYSARLFSQWSDNFSTEIRVSRNDVTDLQNPFGGGEAQGENLVRLSVEDINAPRSDGLLSGPGFNRSANELNYELDQVKIAGDYLWGDHTFTFGYELDSLSVFNLFAQNATGTITFDGIDNFAAGIASDIDGTGSFTGDINDAAAEFSRDIHSLYIQDEWDVTDSFRLIAGLRYDWYSSSDEPTFNQTFVDRYGFDNTQAFGGLDIFLPRLGFTYDLPESFGDTTINGGVGVFSGGDPTVWFSNAFSNFGSALGQGDISGPGCTAADLQVIQNGQFTGLPQCITDQQIANANQGLGRTDAVDPNFSLPSQIRYSLGVIHRTDFESDFLSDWEIQVDAIYSDLRNAADFVDLTLTPVGTAPDGRPIFNAIDPLLDGCNAVFAGIRDGFTGVTDACDAGRDDQDILLTNDVNGSGHSFSLSAQFRKFFQLGDRTDLNVNFGYAYTDSKVGNPTTSSTATSNFEEVAVAILNRPDQAANPFTNTHNLTFAATLSHEFIEDHKTSLSAFFRARSGRPFSYTFDGDTGEDFFGDTDDEERILFYVPTGPNDPLVQLNLSPEDERAFFNFLESSGLNEFAGGIAPRNAFRQQWSTDLDLRFQQELPSPVKGHKFTFFVDFENFLNFLDDDRNVQRFFDNGQVAEAVPVAPAAIENGQYVISSFNPGGSSSRAFGFDPNNDRDVDDSVWRVQFGIRYEF